MSISEIFTSQYQWACKYIKPGDRVLNHVSHFGVEVIERQTDAASVTESKNTLDLLSDETFEVIVSFEIEQNAKRQELQQLLQEFYRLLTPGGRVVMSIPVTGHERKELQQAIAEKFILENIDIQIEQHKKIQIKNLTWDSSESVTPSKEAAFFLMTFMKSPLGATLPYQERVLAHLMHINHPSIRYNNFFINPWIMYSMVNFCYRLKNPTALEKLATQLLDSMPSDSNDYAAALCVKAYQVNAHIHERQSEAKLIISQIDQFTTKTYKDEMGLRWVVSLLFIKGKMLQALDCLEEAKQAFIACSKFDVRKFGVHLATKTTEAVFLAGRIAYIQGNHEEALNYWRRGVADGKMLLAVSIEDILIDTEFPNLFNQGDGVREYATAWDNLARCANGIHLLKSDRIFDFALLDNCYQTEYASIHQDLINTRRLLIKHHKMLAQLNFFQQLIAHCRYYGYRFFQKFKAKIRAFKK